MMELMNDRDADSGYEASSEAASDPASPTSDGFSISPRILNMPSQTRRLRSSNQSQHLASSQYLPNENAAHHFISSSSPEVVHGSTDLPKCRHELLSTSSISPIKTLQRPESDPQITYPKGMPAWEVAQRAQDSMLIRAGHQKSPAQLLTKVTRRPIVYEGGQAWWYSRSCYDCEQKQASHNSSGPFLISLSLRPCGRSRAHTWNTNPQQTPRP